MLKRIALATVVGLSSLSCASAADMNYSKDRFDWSGLFVSTQAGAGSGEVGFAAAPGFPDPNLPTSIDISNGVAGVSAGYNWQVDDWVFGLEAGWLGGEFEGSKHFVGNNVEYTVMLKDIVTVGPRIGYAFDNFHVYGELGYASANIDALAKDFPSTLIATFDDATVGGYFVGAGFDYAIDGNWLFGAEYNHVELNDKTLTGIQLPATPGKAIAKNMSVDTLALKITYKFD